VLASPKFAVATLAGAFFKRLLIEDDYAVVGELTEPFDWLLNDQLRRAAALLWAWV
jgi:hypothetical protein